MARKISMRLPVTFVSLLALLASLPVVADFHDIEVRCPDDCIVKVEPEGTWARFTVQIPDEGVLELAVTKFKPKYGQVPDVGFTAVENRHLRSNKPVEVLVGGLTPGSHYYWLVRVKDNYKSTKWSPSWIVGSMWTKKVWYVQVIWKEFEALGLRDVPCDCRFFVFATVPPERIVEEGPFKNPAFIFDFEEPLFDLELRSPAYRTPGRQNTRTSDKYGFAWGEMGFHIVAREGNITDDFHYVTTLELPTARRGKRKGLGEATIHAVGSGFDLRFTFELEVAYTKDLDKQPLDVSDLQMKKVKPGVADEVGRGELNPTIDPDKATGTPRDDLIQ